MSTTSKSRAAVDTIATIRKSNSSQFRVMLSTWKGETKIKFANFTSVIADIYFQAGPSITLPIDRLDELIDALAAAKKRGLR